MSTENEILQNKLDLIAKSQDGELFKSFSSDLKSRFPDGKWVTMSGSHVFINGKTVIAGLDSMNKTIDEAVSKESKPTLNINRESIDSMKPDAVAEKTVDGDTYQMVRSSGKRGYNLLKNGVNALPGGKISRRDFNDFVEIQHEKSSKNTLSETERGELTKLTKQQDELNNKSSELMDRYKGNVPASEVDKFRAKYNDEYFNVAKELTKFHVISQYDSLNPNYSSVNNEIYKVSKQKFLKSNGYSNASVSNSKGEKVTLEADGDGINVKFGNQSVARFNSKKWNDAIKSASEELYKRTK